MPTKTFSFEEGLGTGIKFADRTKPEAPSEKILPGFNADGGDDILGRLQSIADTHGTRITSGYRNPINYGAGKKSAHGDRRAGDFRTKDMSREASDKLIEDLKSQGFWVSDERDNWQAINPKTGKQRGTGPHIHAEWRGEGGSGGAGSDGTPAPQKKTFSFEDALGTRKPMAEVAPALVQPKDAPKTNHSILPEIMKGLRSDSPNSVVPSFISEPVERSLDAIGKAIRTRYQSVTGQLSKDDPDYNPAPPFKLDRALVSMTPTGAFFVNKVAPYTKEDYANDPHIAQRREVAKAKVVEREAELSSKMGTGFWDNLRNPVDLLLNDSLPANLIEWASASYDQGFDRLMEARAVQGQEYILAHPERYSAAAVAAARKASDERKVKEGKGVSAAWGDLKQAAKENPKKFGATLVNALIADPEMLLVPQGLGIKVAATVERLGKGATVATKAAQIADRIIDPAITGAGLNVAFSAAAAGSEGRDLSFGEGAVAAGLGAGLGGLFGIFTRGKAAADDLAAGKLTEENLQDAIHSMAQAEVFLDDLKSPATFVNVKHQIERATGIKFESQKDLEAYLESERTRWEKLFADRDLHGQYQEALADERIARRTVLAEEAEAKTARVAAEGEREAAVAAAYEQKASDRIATFNSDYEKALAARDAVDMNDLHQQAIMENDLRAADAKLTEEEILDAARSGNIPEVKRAMLKAAARDAKLRVPKWQRGEVDTKLLARLGVGALFAGTAYAAADDKEVSALAAGLAGLLVPGGGRVAGRMRQAGSTTVDNLFTEAAEKFLKPTKFSDEATNAQMKKDAAAIERAKAGDQKAFNELYQDHSRKLIGTIRRRIQGYAGRYGLDAEDIAMEAMTDAFINLDKYKPDAPFSAYLNQIAKNKASSAVRQGRASMRGGKFDIESASVPSMVDSFGEPTGVADAFDRGAGADMQTTPETIALAEEARDIFMRELQKLPETKRIAVLLKNAEGASTKEIAQKLGMQETATQVMIHRAEKDLLDAIQNRKGAARAHHELAKPTGEIVKRGRGRPRKIVGGIDSDLLVKMGVGAGVAVAAATAGAQMFPKDPKKGALAGVMLAGLGVLSSRFSAGSRGSKGRTNQVGAVKLKGGNWERNSAQNLTPDSGGYYGDSVTNAVHKYLQRYAGTVDDPLKDISLPDGTRWEDAMDKAIRQKETPDKYGERLHTFGPASEHRYPRESIAYLGEAGSEAVGKIRSYMNHVGDYLRTLPESEVLKMDFVRMVKETKRWDEANAKKMENATAKSLKDAEVFKEYDDGFKWIRLNKPGQFANESDLMGHSVRGYEPTKTEGRSIDEYPESPLWFQRLEDFKERNNVKLDVEGLDYAEIKQALKDVADWKPKARASAHGLIEDLDRMTSGHAEWTPESVGGHKYYGYGGWDAIKDDQARIYSLRDAKGKPVATVEMGKSFPDYPMELSQVKGPRNEPVKSAYGEKVIDLIEETGVRLRDNSLVDLVAAKFTDESGRLKKIADREITSSRYQRGEVDPKLLAAGAKLTVAALVGLAASQFFVDPNDAEGNPDPKKRFSPLISAAGTTALAAVAMLSKGRGTKSLARATADAIDYAFGSSSTRILNKSEKVFGAIQSTIRRTSSETHRYIEEVNPFLKKMNDLPQATQDIVARALYTGKASVINKILESLGDPELSRAYKSVRGTLDSLGDKLVTLKRFSKGAFEYFPRIIKDKEGLFAAIGKERSGEITKIVDDANIESLKKSGKPLTGFEENALINSILFGGDNKHLQPGWTKSRGIEEITPELLPFYATPAESLHSYIRSAVADIEKAKFFGDYARNMKVGGHEFLDTDASVGLMMREELAKGKLTDADAKEIGSILKTFFNEGSMGESSAMRTIKDTMYMGLLGNFMSTLTQLADVAVPIFTQDMRSTIAAVIRQATGRKVISSRELGLADNISQEFASQSKSTRALNKLLKVTLFSQIDQIGKNTSLNAAVLRAQRLVKQEDGSGITTLSKKYAEIFGKDFNTLVADLKAGKVTDVVKDYAWMELSRTQPISMLEMPELYMKHPKFRSYLMLKSFVIKQIDLVRRDAIQDIASLQPARVTKGIKNLAEMTIVMGTAGMGTQAVKDWLQGKDVKLELSAIPFNLIKNLGWSEYQIDKFKGVTKEEAARRREAGEPGGRAQEAAPLKAVGEFVVPPYDMFEQIVTGDPGALRYLVPGIGPQVARWAKDSMALEQEVNANE